MPLTRLGYGVIAIVVVAVVVIGVVLAVVIKPQGGTVDMYAEGQSADWSDVFVTFVQVQVLPVNASNTTGWVTLTVLADTVDLLGPANLSRPVASSVVPAGDYGQIRLVISSATGQMLNGSLVEFLVPSGVLVVTHPFIVTDGGTVALTLTMDLQQSIVQRGQDWIFTPVLGSLVTS